MSTRILLLFFIIGCTISQNTCPCSAYTFIEDYCIEYLDGEKCPDDQLLGPDTRVAELSDWPYLISFQWDYSNRGEGCYEHFCSGMLIAPNIAITAAHCFMGNFGPDIYEAVPYPEIYVAQTPPCRHFASSKDKQRILVSKVYWSEFWDRSKKTGDIAIVELNQSLPGPYLKLQTEELESDIQQEFRVCGYGAHNPQEPADNPSNARQLYEADVVYLSQGICGLYLDVVEENDALLNYETMLCAYNLMADSCRGDSGGPVVIKGGSPKDDILVGIVSWGPSTQCKHELSPQAPIVLARVSYFSEWIDTTLASIQNK
eukprot:TRINITY_DN970_c0_g1_i7.p1 TRINITY_DN970_c0_g1~~TRINITY_DN970_c0_g1_i7.p1  ORF type:complete len:323 (-),score=18.45 TRINITY_DN970_c0_g1_i7:238-1185(-)